MQNDLKKIYELRFSGELEKKQKMWQILCKNYFQKFIDNNDIVVDIATGYGEFLNNIKAKKKIAVDLNPSIKQFVNKDIEVIISDCKKIACLQDNSVDEIFISNFLEHLNNTNEVIEVLHECFRILKSDGKILILQPNIFYVKEKYWFFIDHKTPITHKSLAEALKICGFKIEFLKKKFLPYSTKSIFPQTSFLIKTYLIFDFLQLIFGKQSFVIAKK